MCSRNLCGKLSILGQSNVTKFFYIKTKLAVCSTQIEMEPYLHACMMALGNSCG